MTQETPASRRKRTLVGSVVSDKMDKTIVVALERSYRHPVFQKYVVTRRKYKAHDERNEAKTGDVVEIVESRRLSATKRWRLRRVLQRHVG